MSANRGAMDIKVSATPTLNPLNPSLIHNMAIAAPLFSQVIKPIPTSIAADTGIAENVIFGL